MNDAVTATPGVPGATVPLQLYAAYYVSRHNDSALDLFYGEGPPDRYEMIEANLDGEFDEDRETLDLYGPLALAPGLALVAAGGADAVVAAQRRLYGVVYETSQGPSSVNLYYWDEAPERDAYVRDTFGGYAGDEGLDEGEGFDPDRETLDILGPLDAPAGFVLVETAGPVAEGEVAGRVL